MVARRVWVLIISILLLQPLVIGETTETSSEPGPRNWIQDPLVAELIQRATDNMTEEFIYSAIENLTSFETRYAHSIQNPKAAQWIYDEFKSYGYEVEKWNFTHQFSELSNIVATLPGTDPDGYIVVCAHLDSANWPGSFDHPETPAPGADDDATGVAAILQVAKVLKRYKFKQDIKFIAFNAEELIRAVGSTRYVENATAAGENILAVLNVDMIGYNNKYIKMDIVYDVATQSHDLFTDYINPVNMDFGFIDRLYDKEDPKSPNSWGDINPFWDDGYKGVAFVESLWPRSDDPYYIANPNYHTENDTLDTINIELTNQGGKLVAGTLISMARPTLPDVEISQISVPEEMVFEDRVMEIKATVTNIGNHDAENVQVNFTIDGINNESRFIDVPLSGPVNMTFNWSTVPGDHVFGIVLDQADVLGEWDEGNNNRTVSKFVQIKPDIVLQRFELLESNITQGDVVHLAVKAVNTGPTDIECNFTIMDDREKEPFIKEFIQLDVNGEWEMIYKWTSSMNGTHVLSGMFTDFFPQDRNESNNMLTDSIDINGIPVARFFTNPKVEALTFQDILFLADASSDDKEITGFNYNFGDGNETDWTDQPSVTHNYSQDGTYTATLMVRDEVGSVSDPVIRSVTIQNREPVVRITADRTVAETGSPITFSSDETFDLDGRIVSYNWTFSPGPIFSSIADPRPIRFHEMGTVTARLLVTDDDGATASASITVSITNKPPDAMIEGPRIVAMGEVIEFVGSGSTDSDGRITKWYWTFGDGSFSGETDPTHAYSVPGNYTIELTVTDNHGGKDKTTWSVLVTKGPIRKDQELVLSDLYLLIVFLVVIVIYVIGDIMGRGRGPQKDMKW